MLKVYSVDGNSWVNREIISRIIENVFRVLISAICLSFFPPSSKFQLLLERYISGQTNGEMNTSEVPVSIYAKVCQKRLEKILQTGPKKGLKKPTLEEIELSKV